MPLKQLLHRSYKNLETRSHELIYLFLEITRRCNLNCLHCGSDCTSREQSPELTTTSWLKIIDYFSRYFSPRLNFILTGGEPLLHPDLLTIADALQAARRRWGMVSNAQLHTPDVLNALMARGLSSMTLSLDGAEQSHDHLRHRPGAYHKTLAALHLLGQSKLEYKDVVTCVYPRNLGELEGVAEILLAAGIKSWRLFRIFPSGRAHDNSELLLDAEQTRWLLQWIRDHRPRLKKRGLQVDFSCEGYMPWQWDTAVRSEPFFCRAGINIASILADGSITGCSNNQSRFTQGNILRDNFTQVWEEGFLDFRDRQWASTGKCAKCREWKYCQGSSIHLWQDGSDEVGFCYRMI